MTSPIQTNNLGTDYRDITDIALKLDYSPGYGTFTSTSDFNHTKEIDTGDAYDFRPIKNSIDYNYFAPLYYGSLPLAAAVPFDESQSQFIAEKTYSQELRFTSNAVDGFSWIAGAYFVHTERFISTGNLVDRGDGVPAVYETPLVDPSNPYRNQHQPDVPRGLAEQQCLGGVWRCDLRVQQAVGDRCGDALRHR